MELTAQGTPTQDEFPQSSGIVLEKFEDYDAVMSTVSIINSRPVSDMEDELLYQQFKTRLDKYWEQPHLLDSCIDEIVKGLLAPVRYQGCPEEVMHRCFRFLLIPTRVRGYKATARYFPHEVTDVNPVLMLLERLTSDSASTWHSRYVLLLWLSILAMVPFQLSRLESGDEPNKSVIRRVLDVIKGNLKKGDEANLGAAIVVAKFIARPDVTDSHLDTFLAWLLEQINPADVHTNVTVGLLSSLAGIFKSVKRKHIEKHAASVLKVLVEKEVLKSKNIVIRKLTVKLLQRIGLSLLPAILAPWRYFKSTRKLVEGIRSSSLTENAFPYLQEQDMFDVPEMIEEVIDNLLEGLSDDALIVRWSAAKGIGRITSRLPKDLASEVVSSILSLFGQWDSDSSWHGACLAVAELGRRGSLLPGHLSTVVNSILLAMAFDEQRGRCSVGAMVRDSACYVCWTLGRSYDPVDIEPFVCSIASTLVCTSLFDREVNCRRAAAAAFQECVGRLGTFPHGIAIITIANYYSVSNLTSSFLEVSGQVADFPEYTRALIHHLVDKKVGHWDLNIRKLASRSLFSLTAKDPDYIKDSCLHVLVPRLTSPNLLLKHGAVLAVSEVVHALSIWAGHHKKGLKDVLGPAIIETLECLLATYEQDKTFFGIGCSMMKGAFCFLLSKLACAHFPVHGCWGVLEQWMSLINSCLVSPSNSGGNEAAVALSSVMGEYYKGAEDLQEKIVRSLLENLHSDVQERCCSLALAIGSLPSFVHEQYFPAILRGLLECARTEGPDWVHTRKEATLALSKVCISVGGSGRLRGPDIDDVMDVFRCSMEDYSQNKQGDVGMVVRKACMRAFSDLVCFLASSNADLIRESHVSSMMCAIAQQCVEVVDENRRFGMQIFLVILYSAPAVPYVPHSNEAQTILPQEVSPGVGLAYASNAFPYWGKFLTLPTYTKSLFRGFLVSAGSLNEHVFEPAKDALSSYLHSIEGDVEKERNVCTVLIDLLGDESYMHRAIVYYMNAMARLVTHGAFVTFPSEFIDRLQYVIWQKIMRTKSFPKLHAAMTMFCSLLNFEGECRLHLLQKMLLLLVHRYASVRIATAEKLCEAFLLFPFLDTDHMDEACTILSETNWSAPKKDLEPMRKRLASILGIEAAPLQSK